MPTLGVLTIGQSPRPDGLAADVQTIVGPGLRVIERGALDGLVREEIAGLSPRDGQYRLITLLNDGTAVQIRKEAILTRLQEQITRLETEDNVVGTLLLCTGAFPPFYHDRSLIQPQAALYGAVQGLGSHGQIGALLPLPEQCEQGRAKWRKFGVTDVVLGVANPYGDDPCGRVADAASAAREMGASVLFLDCFGYDLAMRDAARQSFGGAVVLARGLAARLMAELFC